MLDAASVPLAVDDATLGRARHGDREAFADIVREHQAMVFSIAYHFIGRREVAEELAQDVFLRLFQHVQGIESPSHLTFWLRRVTSRCCIDWFRQRTRRREVGVDPLPDAPVDSNPRDVLLERRLHRVVQELPETARLVVTLKYQEGLDPADIAAVLDVPVNTVKSHLRRSIELLRARLGGSEKRV
jgi:RNA polymerase sigma-70 factor (ECF subfamily)